MKVTRFGEAVRILRLRYDVSLKQMADALGISSSHMSGVEYGEKTLTDKHIDGAIAFFDGVATREELQHLKRAGLSSKSNVDLEPLEPESRRLVAAFARRLARGDAPPSGFGDWVESRM